MGPSIACLILQEALRAQAGSFAERAAALRARTGGRKTGEAAALIREDRDARVRLG